jgi:hypothetical protein
MTQVIEIIGGEYRNRTGLHGFAIPLMSLKRQKKIVNVPLLGVSRNQRVTSNL